MAEDKKPEAEQQASAEWNVLVTKTLLEEGIKLVLDCYDAEYERTLLIPDTKELGPRFYDFFRKMKFYSFLTPLSIKTTYEILFVEEMSLQFWLNFNERAKFRLSMRSGIGTKDLMYSMIESTSMAFGVDKGATSNQLLLAPESAKSLENRVEDVRKLLDTNPLLFFLLIVGMNFHHTRHYAFITEAAFANPAKTV